MNDFKVNFEGIYGDLACFQSGLFEGISKWFWVGFEWNKTLLNTTLHVFEHSLALRPFSFKKKALIPKITQNWAQLSTILKMHSEY